MSEVFKENHEKIISLNVLLSLFRLQVIGFEANNNNQFAHNTAKTDEYIAIFTGLNDQKRD